MKQIVDRDEKISREVGTAREAIAHSRTSARPYSRSREHSGRGAITVYRQAAWKDLCRGPHLPSTRYIGKAFKLNQACRARRLLARRPEQRPAAAHLRHGLGVEADLEAYLKRVEEAEKRDHRKIGGPWDLFHMQEEGKGMVFWHEKADAVAHDRELTSAALARRHVEVRTPQVLEPSVLGKVRPLGEVPAEHVRLRDGGG